MEIFQGETVFFTSDTHFGHKNVIKFCNRPYSTTKSMNHEFIENWNEKVQADDTVFHLGDFGREKPDVLISIIKQLNGHIHLLLGNHDKKSWGVTSRVLDCFDSVSSYKEIFVSDPELEKNVPIVLLHYPMETWNESHWGSIHLHGHCHGSLPARGNRMDVGVDGHRPDVVARYAPYSWEDIKTVMTKRKMKTNDVDGKNTNKAVSTRNS